MVNIPEQNEYYLGQLFYFFEFACGVSGYVSGVNPFNQPGERATRKHVCSFWKNRDTKKKRRTSEKIVERIYGDTIQQAEAHASDKGLLWLPHAGTQKRNQIRFCEGLPLWDDITEIEGFDDLHHADGIIKKPSRRRPGSYGAEETKFLQNGSTAGDFKCCSWLYEKGDQISCCKKLS